MKPEGGITEFSLANAAELIAQRGQPAKLDFMANVKRGDYYVTATWPDGFEFCFSGFAWGYGGTACQGLGQFLASLGITDLDSWSVPIDQSGQTSATYNLDSPRS